MFLTAADIWWAAQDPLNPWAYLHVNTARAQAQHQLRYAQAQLPFDIAKANAEHQRTLDVAPGQETKSNADSEAAKIWVDTMAPQFADTLNDFSDHALTYIQTTAPAANTADDAIADHFSPYAQSMTSAGAQLVNAEASADKQWADTAIPGAESADNALSDHLLTYVQTMAPQVKQANKSFADHALTWIGSALSGWQTKLNAETAAAKAWVVTASGEVSQALNDLSTNALAKVQTVNPAAKALADAKVDNAVTYANAVIGAAQQAADEKADHSETAANSIASALTTSSNNLGAVALAQATAQANTLVGAGQSGGGSGTSGSSGPNGTGTSSLPAWQLGNKIGGNFDHLIEKAQEEWTPIPLDNGMHGPLPPPLPPALAIVPDPPVRRTVIFDCETGLPDRLNSPSGTIHIGKDDGATRRFLDRLKLESDRGPITKLIIGAHGNPGSMELFGNSFGYNSFEYLDAQVATLTAIADAMEDNSTLVIVGCASGYGSVGRMLELKLEKFFSDHGKKIDVVLFKEEMKWNMWYPDHLQFFPYIPPKSN